MCLPNFKRFKQISENSPLIGYRNWRLVIKSNELMSESMNYIWNKTIEGPHEVLKDNSGIYAYNNYYYNYYYDNYNNNYYYNNYYDNNYYHNNNYNNNYYHNYYRVSGIISQYGRVAIHETGQRSEYAKIDTLFTIRESDAKGSKEFLDWIKKFNNQVEEVAKRFNTKTKHWQDFVKITIQDEEGEG